MRVLITGVRGKTGVELAGLLAARGGIEVLGGSSDPTSVDLPGVVATRLSWDAPASFAPALEGVDAVFLVRPDRADAPELMAQLLTHAPRTSRVVLLSEQDADYSGPDGWAPRGEAAVRDSGLPWSIVRPSWFMQVFTDDRFFPGLLTDGGELEFASDGGLVAWIDARDIAAVAEQALVDDALAGQVLEVTGPEALSLPHTAEVLAAATGRDVHHRDLAIEEAVAGSEGFARELDALTFERVGAGSFATVTDTVERVTGRQATSLSGFLERVRPQER